jgi:hypothetical protein
LPGEKQLEEVVPIAFADLPPTDGDDELKRLMSALPVCESPFEKQCCYMFVFCGQHFLAWLIVLSTAGLNPGEHRVWRTSLRTQNGNYRFGSGF